MTFASGLRQSLEVRHCQFPSEFSRGDSLEEVLERHLLAVEAMADGDLLTSILLLSTDGKRLFHGAAPNLPQSYRESIDGFEIGPSAGSCGTAAFLDCPIYVDDIATDPLWADYRHLALPHGLRSCWSTPIRDDDDEVIGTFAIYHRRPVGPTRDELEAIAMITDLVAQAIMWARNSGQLEPQRAGATREAPRLRLVSNNPEPAPAAPFASLLMKTARLETLTSELQRRAGSVTSSEWRAGVEILAQHSRNLAEVIRSHVGRFGESGN